MHRGAPAFSALAGSILEIDRAFSELPGSILEIDRAFSELTAPIVEIDRAPFRAARISAQASGSARPVSRNARPRRTMRPPMRTQLVLAGLVALALAGCGDPTCPAPYIYNSVYHWCECRPGEAVGDGGGCISLDAGPSDALPTCPGGAAPVALYADEDGDGHGNPATERMGCPGEPDTASAGDDCDDACPSCHPGGTEICDARDNDCAMGPDDLFACVQGTPTACTTTCSTAGTTTCAADCTLPPAAECTPPAETCNTADDDCDGAIDEDLIVAGAPVVWPGVTGMPALVDTGTEIVAVFAGTDGAGLFASRYDRAGAPLDSPMMIDAMHVDSVDAVLHGGSIAIAVGNGDRMLIAEVDPDLTVRTAPRLVTTRAGASDLRIVDVGLGVLLVYHGSSGELFARNIASLASGSGTERTIVGPRGGRFLRSDVTIRAASLGRTYHAYEATVGAEPDPELFVVATDASGVPLEAALRVTTNSGADTTPAIAANASGEIAVAWAETPDTTTVVGEVRLAVFTHGTGGWAEVRRSTVSLGSAHVLLARQIRLVPVPEGWAIALLDERGEQHVQLVASGLGASGGPIVPAALPAAGWRDLTLGLLPGLLLTARVDAALGSGSVRAFPLGCP